MKKKYSFKPKINKKSRILDKKNTQTVQEIPRHEILHELNFVLKEKEEQKQMLAEKIKYEKFMSEEGKECTF